MPVISLPSNTRFDIKYREQYVSEALNKKQYKIDPYGIYQGFWLEKVNDNLIRLSPDYSGSGMSHSIAIVESNGVAVKVEVPTTINITIDDISGYTQDIWTIYLVVNYSIGVPTTGEIQILNSSSPQPSNSIGLGCFRVLSSPTRVDDVFPLHKGLSSSSKSMFYQGASIGYTRDLMTKHYITQNGDFKNGFQGWNYDKAELYYTPVANSFPVFNGVKLGSGGFLSSELYPIANTNVYLGVSLKREDGLSVFDGDISFGYALFDINRVQIGNYVLKKIAINGQPNNGNSFTWLAWVDKINNSNAKYISIGIINTGSPIIVNRIYAVLPFDENDIYVSGSNQFYKNLIANEFQLENFDINYSSDGYITLPVFSDKYWYIRCKAGGNVNYNNDSNLLNITIPASGAVSIVTSKKIRINNYRNNFYKLRICFEYGGNYSDVDLDCNVLFYKNLSDSSHSYLWKPRYGLSLIENIPLNKIVTDTNNVFESIIDKKSTTSDDFEKYSFVQILLVFNNNSNSDRNIRIKKIEFLGRSDNCGVEEFTDVIIRGEINANNELYGGGLTASNNIILKKLNDNIANDIGIESVNRKISLKLDENNERKLIFSDKILGQWHNFDVIYDGSNGISGDFDYIKIENNGRLELSAGSKLICGGSIGGKINIDSVDHDDINFASKLGANPSARFHSYLGKTIQSQIDALSDRYYILPVYFDRYKGSTGQQTGTADRLYYIILVDYNGYKWKSAGIFSFVLPNKILDISIPLHRLYVQNEVIPNAYFHFKFNRAKGNNTVVKYSDNGISLGTARNSYISVTFTFTSNDVDWLNNNRGYIIEISPAILINGTEQNYDNEESHGSNVLKICSYGDSASGMISAGNFLLVRYTSAP